MFFAEYYLGGKKFRDIRDRAKSGMLSGGVYMKLVFLMLFCVASAVSTVMLDYMILNIIDASGVLDFADSIVWFILEFGSYFLLLVFVAVPIGCGWLRTVYMLMRGENVSVLECFWCFRNAKIYFRTLLFSLSFDVRMLLFAVLCFGRGDITEYILSFFAAEVRGIVAFPIEILVNTAAFAVFVLVLILGGRGFGSFAIFVRNEKVALSDIRKTSRTLSRGRLWRIFLYKIAYIPQMLLSLITVLIYGFVYFAPMYTAAYFVAVDELMAVSDGKI